MNAPALCRCTLTSSKHHWKELIKSEFYLAIQSNAHKNNLRRPQGILCCWEPRNHLLVLLWERFPNELSSSSSGPAPIMPQLRLATLLILIHNKERRLLIRIQANWTLSTVNHRTPTIQMRQFKLLLRTNHVAKNLFVFDDSSDLRRSFGTILGYLLIFGAAHRRENLGLVRSKSNQHPEW